MFIEFEVDYIFIKEKFRNNKLRIIEVDVYQKNAVYLIQFKASIFRIKLFNKFIFGDKWDSLKLGNNSVLIFDTYTDAFDFYSKSNGSTFKLINLASNL